MTPKFVGLLALGAAVLGACSFGESSEDTPDGPSGAGASGQSAGGMGPATTGADTSSSSATSGAGGGGGVADAKETPGQIQCGKTTCPTASQKCCPSSDPPICIDNDVGCPGEIMQVGSVLEMKCDDAADCQGAICCLDPAGGGSVSYECKAAPCGFHEACIPGGICSAGFDCVDDPGSATGARCVASGAAVTCGAATCSMPDGACCSDSTAECGPYGSDCIAQLECDDAQDCGAGYDCCGAATESSSTCVAAGKCTGVVLCADDTECSGGTCSLNAGGFPSNVKTCN